MTSIWQPHRATAAVSETPFIRRRITLWGLHNRSTNSFGLMAVSLSRQTKPSWPTPADSATCLFRKVQRSPRPGLKQRSQPVSRQAKTCTATQPGAFGTSSRGNCDTHGKINCLTLKVNTFFGIPVNYDIPETELSQPTKLTVTSPKQQLTTSNYGPACGIESPPQYA